MRRLIVNLFFGMLMVCFLQFLFVPDGNTGTLGNHLRGSIFAFANADFWEDWSTQLEKFNAKSDRITSAYRGNIGENFEEISLSLFGEAPKEISLQPTYEVHIPDHFIYEEVSLHGQNYHDAIEELAVSDEVKNQLHFIAQVGAQRKEQLKIIEEALQ